MENPPSFCVFYTDTSMIDTAITACKKNNISLLAIQQPGFTVSEPDSDANTTIVADLNDDDAISIVYEAAAILMPRMLVFGVGPERGEDRFTVTRPEINIIQELFWLHAGKTGFIQTSFQNWPSVKPLHQDANHKLEEVAA